MSDYIDTRDGTWSEVDERTFYAVYDVETMRTFAGRGGSGRFWVREAPVPPLPTAENTLIEVNWKAGHPASVYRLTDMWRDVEEPGTGFSADLLVALITGFEVLAEPRAVTAQAVIDRVRAEYNDDDAVLRVIARDFGGES